jgi:hypothetical protein
MASSSQGSTVTFKGTALQEVTNVAVSRTKDSAGKTDNRIDISHLGIPTGGKKLYMSAVLEEVAVSTEDGLGGDVTVEMLTAGPEAGSKGALSVSGGGQNVTLSCVEVTSSGFTLATGEAAKASVTFTIVSDDVCAGTP